MLNSSPYIGQKLIVSKVYEDDECLNSGMTQGQKGIVVRILSRKEYGNDRIWIYVTNKHQFYSVSNTQVTANSHYSYSQINRIIADIKSNDAYRNEKELTIPIIDNLNKAKKIFKRVKDKENVK